jgi:hypothetical protein
MTSAMRSTLLFMLDQWIRRALGEERVKSRALGSIIGASIFCAANSRSTLFSLKSKGCVDLYNMN